MSQKKDNSKQTTGEADAGARAIEEHNAEYRRQQRKRKNPAKMTAADLIEFDSVPLVVRHWLERYVAGEEYALDTSFVNEDGATMMQARLIFDTLDAEGKEHSDLHFSDEARDYIEEYMYRLAESSGQQVWNHPDIAVAGLAVMLDCSAGSMEGDATNIALETAIRRLTTAAERQDCLRDKRYTADTVEAGTREAGYKLSRTLANPETPAATVAELTRILLEFADLAAVSVAKPVLASRAFMLACEAKPRGKVRQLRALRKQLIDVLDGLPESPKGNGE